MPSIYVCTLSKEEIDNPLLVFDRLFRHNDLPGLRQINVALLRSVMEGKGFCHLTPEEQNTFIRFSSEMARAMEAAHILYLDEQEKQKASFSTVREPETSYNGPSNTLSGKEQGNPLKILKVYAEEFALPTVEALFRKLTAGRTKRTDFVQASAISAALFLYLHSINFLEAVYMLVNEKAVRSGKFTISNYEDLLTRFNHT